MTSKVWIYSGDRPSNGAKELASQDGFKRCRTGKFIKPGDIIVNWGSSKYDFYGQVPKSILNHHNMVAQASNKLTSFAKFKEADVKTVEWTTDIKVAIEWNEEYVVVVRQKLTGHSGDGIIIVEKNSPDMIIAPLYTKYVFKEKEFRVHVVNGAVVDTQQKIKDPDREVVTWKVRSHANGFIFARNNLSPNPARDELAVAATKALGLDFGAVDIIQDKKGHLYVLEINTAPGLEGQTITSYADAFRGFANGS